jgi:ribosomal protein S18 acetylase RimI-like enzyme
MAPRPAYTRRHEEPGDAPFLLRLMTDVIAAELGAGAWPEPMRSHLLGIQAQARRNSRRAEHPNAQSCVLQADGVDAGWMLTSDAEDLLWLVEIAVTPHFQGRGIGSAAIRELLTPGATVRLNVNRTNLPATELYRRLGFQTVEENDVQLTMECRC